MSTRYAPIVVVLIALAGVPTVIHSYMDTAATDGRTAAAIPMELLGREGVATTRRAGWGEDHIGSGDWIERLYTGRPAVTLFVGRSLDAKTLYHHPELAVAYGSPFSPDEIISLPQLPGVPVHLLRPSDPGSRRMALYTLRHEDAYIRSGITFELRNSIAMLFSRRAPMTLFFVSQDQSDSSQALGDTPAAAVLAAAMEAFDRQSRIPE